MANKNKLSKEGTEVPSEVKFTKDQILQAKKYTLIEKDILRVLLEDKNYSLTEVGKLLEEFNKKEAK